MGRYGHVSFLLLLLLSSCLVPLPSSSQLSSNQNTTMFQISGIVSSSPWNTTNPNPCFWNGVNCTRPLSSRNVTQLSLSGLGISTSSLFTPLCELESLQSLDLSSNLLTSIPDAFFSNCSKIPRLKLLNFSGNRLAGSFPSFSKFTALETLDLSYNLFEGGVDSQLAGLIQLRSLNLSFNKFSGPIPANIGSPSMALRELQLSHNQFQDDILAKIRGSKNLTLLDLSFNGLAGSVPDWISELSKLEVLVLSSCNLTGKIPQSLSTIKTLSRFAANSNKFNDTIPQNITKHLEVLDLSFNELSGVIPPDLLSSQNLASVDLSFNRLEGSIPLKLSGRLFRLRLGGNNLTGTIPTQVGELSKLTYLELDANKLVGNIPLQLGNCQNLTLLNLAENQLRGGLPKELGKLSKLVVMKLQRNHITGEMPAEFSDLTKLLTLNLSRNSLTGSIPSFISSLAVLSNLNMECNLLYGKIPTNINTLNSLIELQLGNNSLTGNIPRMPSGLATLNLSSNNFSGSISRDLDGLNQLEVLDLSNNRFTGNVPDFLPKLRSLTHLVLSHNQLSGTMPQFPPYVIVNTDGNKDLMNATNPGVSPSRRKRRISVVLIIVVSVITVVVCLSLAAAIFIIVSSRHSYQVEDVTLQSGKDPPQVVNGCLITDNSIHKSSIDFAKAMEAVSNPANILRKTRFSTYYKAVMPSGASYCVKKLNWIDKVFQLGSQEKFQQELETLGRLTYSNIMTPLAYVLTVDSVYLFYDRLHKGTVFDFLHNGLGDVLDWPSRYSIALGVAEGLTFLHGCNQPVLLLDLSTKSILLKSQKEPQIGDVELYKVIDPSKSTGSLSTIAGSVGYIPPEYAYTMRVTVAGNIYSFGVVLLELLTGKPPVSEGTELAKWALGYSVQSNTQERMLDSRICNASLGIRSQMLSVLRIALNCVNPSPEARPKTKNVLRMLFNAR